MEEIAHIETTTAEEIANKLYVSKEKIFSDEKGKAPKISLKHNDTMMKYLNMVECYAHVYGVSPLYLLGLTPKRYSYEYVAEKGYLEDVMTFGDMESFIYVKSLVVNAYNGSNIEILRNFRNMVYDITKCEEPIVLENIHRFFLSQSKLDGYYLKERIAKREVEEKLNDEYFKLITISCPDPEIEESEDADMVLKIRLQYMQRVEELAECDCKRNRNCARKFNKVARKLANEHQIMLRGLAYIADLKNMEYMDSVTKFIRKVYLKN